MKDIGEPSVGDGPATLVRSQLRGMIPTLRVKARIPVVPPWSNHSSPQWTHRSDELLLYRRVASAAINCPTVWKDVEYESILGSVLKCFWISIEILYQRSAVKYRIQNTEYRIQMTQKSEKSEKNHSKVTFLTFLTYFARHTKYGNIFWMRKIFIFVLWSLILLRSLISRCNFYQQWWVM